MDEDIAGEGKESPRKRPLPRLDRFVELLMPFSWSEYRWQFFSTFRRFAFFFFTTIMQLGLDLNSFFLLHSLQIPVNNKLNHARLLLVAVIAIPAVSEWSAKERAKERMKGQEEEMERGKTERGEERERKGGRQRER